MVVIDKFRGMAGPLGDMTGGEDVTISSGTVGSLLFTTNGVVAWEFVVVTVEDGVGPD